jgi:uncharacterized Zn-binding protein involved in type VI secretion
LPLAATVGSPTSHGTPLGPGPGSPNVLIGGQPAWRASIDLHVCPLVSGTVPHVGGVVGGVVPGGSTTVLINNMPAARKDDIIVESGITNSIASGELSVDIG